MWGGVPRSPRAAGGRTTADDDARVPARRRPATARAVAPAREAAAAVLARARTARRDLDLSWAGTPEFDGLDARDRSLAFDLVSGTLRRRGSIDAVLEDVAGVACERVEPQLLDAVRLGAYQLLFLDRVPSHAAVSDAVEVAARRGRRPAGFANAVLRKVADHGREAFARLSGGEGDAALAVRYSLPVWVVRRWRTGLGAAAEAAFAAATDTPERCLRVNRLHATPEQARAALAGDGVETTTLEDWPDALVVTSGPALETTRAFTEGLVTAQSRGSQLVGRVVADAIAQGVAGEREGEPAAGAVRVADLCAAPGGKAAHVAALAPGAAVTAFDIDEGRCAAMRANLERLGAGAVRVVVADALGLPDRESDRFGHVLLDAPCSGLGVLATRPDLRWRRDEAMLRLHAGTEAALLASAARLVVPGGSLTYAVCSFERDETLAVVAGVDELDGWPADDLGAAFPEVAHPADPRYLLVVPGRDGSSGFFVARLRRPAR